MPLYCLHLPPFAHFCNFLMYMLPPYVPLLRDPPCHLTVLSPPGQTSQVSQPDSGQGQPPGPNSCTQAWSSNAPRPSPLSVSSYSPSSIGHPLTNVSSDQFRQFTLPWSTSHTTNQPLLQTAGNPPTTSQITNQPTPLYKQKEIYLPPLKSPTHQPTPFINYFWNNPLISS